MWQAAFKWVYWAEKIQKNPETSKYLDKLIDLFQIPAQPVVIKAIAHNELIRNIKPDIIQLERVFSGFWLMQ